MNKNEKELPNLLQGLKELHDKQFQMLEQKVNYIISNGITNINIVENTLDELLSLALWQIDNLKELYFKLLDYTKKINQEVSDEYKNYYFETIGEEESKEKKFKL